jgi:hypothetical protein
MYAPPVSEVPSLLMRRPSSSTANPVPFPSASRNTPEAST